MLYRLKRLSLKDEECHLKVFSSIISLGTYQSETNSIVINIYDKALPVDIRDILMHELLHMASTRTTQVGFITGLEVPDIFGDALNEGYTEYLTEKHFKTKTHYTDSEDYNVFFAKGASLRMEFDRLFESVFKRANSVKSIVELLYGRNMGYTRKEIASQLKVSDGGHLTKDLNALIASDFVVRYVPFGESKREEYYKLIDPFCIFYLHFVRNQQSDNQRFWQQNTTLPAINAWRGYAFENVCFNHIDQIKNALGISGVVSSESAWTKKADDEEGLQIDLLIIRADNVVNMCEIKFYSDDFVVDKEYYRTILRRVEMLSLKLSPKVSVYSILITTFGLKKNEYNGAFVKIITFDDLFKQ